MKNDFVRLSIFCDYNKIVTISYDKRKLKKFIRKRYQYNPDDIRNIVVKIGFVKKQLLERNDIYNLHLRISYKTSSVVLGFTEEYKVLKKYIKIKIKRGYDIEKLNNMEEIII